MTKKTIPNKVARYLVPNIWATIPFVGGIVANHKIPNKTPNPKAVKVEEGKNKKRTNTTALKKYKALNRIFLLYFDAR